MYQCEVHLKPKGAHTLHKLLMAAHDPAFDADMVSPELLHAPLPPSAADKLVLAAGRTVKSEVIPAIEVYPLIRSLPRYDPRSCTASPGVLSATLSVAAVCCASRVISSTADSMRGRPTTVRVVCQCVTLVLLCLVVSRRCRSGPSPIVMTRASQVYGARECLQTAWSHARVACPHWHPVWHRHNWTTRRQRRAGHSARHIVRLDTFAVYSRCAQCVCSRTCCAVWRTRQRC